VVDGSQGSADDGADPEDPLQGRNGNGWGQHSESLEAIGNLSMRGWTMQVVVREGSGCLLQ
jgi:hypothetical protein